MEKKIKICIHCGVGGGHDQTCPTQVQTVWKSSPPMTQSFLQSEDELFEKTIRPFGAQATLMMVPKDMTIAKMMVTERIEEEVKAFLHASHARLLEHLRESNAYTVLKENQEQLDEEGIMVGVSRQALDELLALLSNNE